MVRRGDLAAVREGRRVLVARTNLLEWINAHLQPVPAPLWPTRGGAGR